LHLEESQFSDAAGTKASNNKYRNLKPVLGSKFIALAWLAAMVLTSDSRARQCGVITGTCNHEYACFEVSCDAIQANSLIPKNEYEISIPLSPLSPIKSAILINWFNL
jgi:hypothetical protein